MKNVQAEAYAMSRYVRISPTKISIVLNKIRGKNYREALEVLKHLPQKAGSVVWKTIYSAASNAAETFGYEKEKLFIHEAYVNLGPVLKRIQPRAKGKAFQIRKRVSHITVKVSKIA